MHWFTVRIERPDEKTTRFAVEVFEEAREEGGEIIGLDSTPAVIAILKADNPAEAAKLAWERGQAELEAIRQGAVVHTADDLLRALDILPQPQLPEKL
jgi:hypothetical protein